MCVVHAFAKTALREVRTYLQPYKGRDLAHIRVFAAGHDGEMHPTKQGITVAVTDLPKLDEAIDALIAAVEGRGK
jgi:ribosomal protein L21E